MTDYPSGQQLWASTDCTEAVQEAKDYVAQEGYDATTVKIVRSGGMVMVVKR